MSRHLLFKVALIENVICKSFREGGASDTWRRLLDGEGQRGHFMFKKGWSKNKPNKFQETSEKIT